MAPPRSLRKRASKALFHGVDNFRDRLTSRKFLLAVTACVFFATRGKDAWVYIAQIVIAFLAVQTAADFGQQWFGSSYGEYPPAAPGPVPPEEQGD